MAKNMFAKKELNRTSLQSQHAKIKIDLEFRDFLTPLSSDELQDLESSLIKEGCRDSLVVWNGILIDGYHRFEICIRNSIPFKTVEAKGLKSREHVKEWMIINQIGKRNLTTAQKALMAIKLEIVYAELAKQRQIRKPVDKSVPPDLVEQKGRFKKEDKREGEALVQAAKTLKIGTETVRKMKKIIDSDCEVLKHKVMNNEIAIDNASRQIEKLERRAKYEQMEWPKGKYRIIYADPPWSYNDKRPLGYGGADDYYDTMSLDDICKLPVAELADKEAVLYLWATVPLLPEALEVIKAWGFFYRGLFVWDKVKHNIGTYNSVRSELLLIAVNNDHKPCVPDNPVLVDNVQIFERTKHSEKPEQFRKIIENNYQYGNKIELFARKQSKGWDVWGNEVNKANVESA